MRLSEKATKPNMAMEPLLIVVMGVSGTGKSTLAHEFSRRYPFTYVDADSFHSEQSIEQMSKGIPLTNKQRLPWIKRISEQLSLYRQQNINCILAYSGLKKAHRDVIFSAYSNRIAVLLNADEKLITERINQRSDHFMSSKLLSNQLAEMEPFNDEKPLLELDIANSIDALIKQMRGFIIEEGTNI
jgi:gluconokinase